MRAAHYMSQVTGNRFYCETHRQWFGPFPDEDDACDAAAEHDTEVHGYNGEDGAE
jgi:hypothetical protein